MGEYGLSFPKSAKIVVGEDAPWTVEVGRFQFFLRLDARRDLNHLKEFIDQQTR